MILMSLRKPICTTISLGALYASAFSQAKNVLTYEEYIRQSLPLKREIDVFTKEISWAKFDPQVGYVLGNYIPHDGIDGSSIISTSQTGTSQLTRT